MEVVSSCITCLRPILLDPLKREVRYIKDLKENVQQLVREMGELLTQEEDVIQCVRGERLRLMNLLNQNEVDRWLENVNRLKEQVNGIDTEFGEDKRCLPSYCSRRKLAIETQRLIREVEVQSKKKPSIIVDVVQIPPATLVIPTESFKGVAAKMAFKSIVDCLRDKKIAKIGVYGMGGVGKTTIIKHVKNFLQQEHIFGEIVFVTVSQNFDLKAIQKVIAEQIGLKLDRDYSEDTLSIMLHTALQQRKRLLLILDDLWSELSLKDVGISEPLAECKVVLTTRSREICQSMRTDKDIMVELLSPEDAWSLFQENARMDDMHDPDAKKLAKQVAKECGGLPLAIVTVGQAFRGVNDVGVWRNELNQLKDSTMGIARMEEKVFKILKFSFDRLKDKKLQACFLYCSLFPEDYAIRANVLIDHWIWDGLINQRESKQVEADIGRSLLIQLKQACMLEFDDNCDTVKMHDLMRDMAIGITRDNPLFMVKSGKGLEKAPVENEWPNDVERISLMYNDIEILSGQPRCPRLRTLLLNGNYSLSDIISHSFFNNMYNLRVLDLSDTMIGMLPDSICDLEKLHVLLLNNCGRLKMMPSLAKHKELRVLHLSGALVEKMPESLASLENLLELNLESCQKLKMLPSFAKLKKLRNFSIDGCTSIEELPCSLFELKNLHDFSIRNCKKLKILPPFAKLKNLKKLDLSRTSIEELLESLFDLKNLEELYLIECSELKMVHSLVKLKKLKALHLTHTYVEELPESLFELEKLCELNLRSNKKLRMIPSLAKLRDLRKLDLFSCCIEELPESLSILENLRELCLSGCENLKRVPSLEKVEQLRILQLDGAGIEELPKGMERLVALEILNLSRTRSLRSFPHGILPNLSRLQEFSTEGSSCLCSSNAARMMEGRIDCREITGLTGLTKSKFDCDDLSTFFHLFKFLQVKVFDLTFLFNSSQPKFEDRTSFLNFYRNMAYSSSSIEIRGHDDIICLSDLLLYFGLVELDDCYINSCDCMQFALGRGQDINTLFLPNVLKKSLESPQGTLAMLASIHVTACPKLKNLFSLQMLQSLPSLRGIYVVNCETIKELISGDDIKTGESAVVLPELKSLEFTNLPALERISSKPLVCSSPQHIIIGQCPHLKKIPLCIDTLHPYFHGKIVGKKEWWDALDWHDLTKTKLLLQPLFEEDEEKESSVAEEEEKPDGSRLEKAES